MTNDEAADKLDHLIYVAAINQRYHQLMAWRFTISDKVVRIALAVLTVAGLAITLANAMVELSITIAILSAIAAMVLNIVPLGNHARDYTTMFVRWTDLRKDAEVQLIKVKGREQDKETTSDVTERLREMENIRHTIEASEVAPYRKLLRRCQGDENQSRYGMRSRAAINAGHANDRQGEVEAKA